jgi:hypothetical protein
MAEDTVYVMVDRKQRKRDRQTETNKEIRLDQGSNISLKGMLPVT